MKKQERKLENASGSFINFNISLVKLYFILIIVSFTLVQCNDSGDNPEIEDPEIVEIIPDSGMDLYGFIGDGNGNPVEGVVVSDGYNCVVTDIDGIYQMKKNADAEFVFYSIPSGYAINVVSETIKMASFFEAISDTERHDFEIEKLDNMETDFTLVCIGDPQVTKAEEITRFKSETIYDLKQFLAAESKPCYSIVFGDVVGNEPALFGQMKVVMGSTDMPVYTTNWES